MRSLTLEYLDGIARPRPSPVLRPLDGAPTPAVNGYHAVPPATLDRPSVMIGPSIRVDYRYISDAAALAAILPDLAGAPVVGLDTETTGLDPRADRLRMIQLATPTKTYVVDCFRVDPTPLRDWLATSDTVKVGHNLKFDLQFLLSRGLAVGGVFDTMLADLLLTAGTGTPMRGLAALATEVLGQDIPKDERTSDWSGDLTDNQLTYAARDAVILPRLHAALSATLTEAKLDRVARLENRAVPAIAWLEYVGCPFDGERWRALADMALLDTIRAKQALDALAGSIVPTGQMLPVKVNWASVKQVKEILGAAGVDVGDTSAETLAQNAAAPLVAALLQYRDAQKRCGTYGLEFLGYTNPSTGRIHPDWRQMGSVAGRMACQKPNLQNLPRNPAYRACFAAPTGRLLVTCDFSQLELRLAAEISGDATLIDAYQQGADVHVLTAQKVLGVTDVSKQQRQLAKALNFGLLYGAGAETLRRYAAANYGVTMTEDDATQFRANFFTTYAGLRRWHSNVGHRLRAGAAETRTQAGRRRLFLDPAKRKFTEYVNTPVQGSGGDAIKAALAVLWETRERCPGAVPVLCVHDEIVLECAPEQTTEAAAWLSSAMTDALGSFLRRVPVGDLEIKVGADWAMHDAT